MYGYIRPLKPELRIREYELFHAAYCGLCHSLKRRYGSLSRFVVSYDMTFLTMLLSPPKCAEARRCPRHWLRKRSCLCPSAALDRTADYGVILAYAKLEDDREDKPFFASLPARLGCLLLRPSYRKAAGYRPLFASRVIECLSELRRLEKERCASLDRPADCFARILSACGEETQEEASRRVQQEILYHAGRSIYLLDAIDDLEDDIRDGSYNPLSFRFNGNSITDSEKEELRSTLNLSQHRMASALQLRGEDVWQSILENIICFGIPAVTEQILSGTWRENKRRISDHSPEGKRE